MDYHLASPPCRVSNFKATFKILSFQASEKGVKRNYKASGRLISNIWHLVQTQRAKVGLVRMQMVLEGVAVIYKTGRSR